MPSVVDKLFYNRYWINVEERAFYSNEELAEIGLMGVNSQEEAMAVLSRPRQIRCTIVDLANYFSRNIKIQIINKPDATEIYEILDMHLHNWKTHCNRNGYIQDIPPFADFEKLDRLAEALYEFKRRSVGHTALLTLLGSPVSSADQSTPEVGIYRSYLPELFEYCAQVHGVEDVTST